MKLVPGYAPAAATNIQVAQLTTLLADYRQSNKDVATTAPRSTPPNGRAKRATDGEDSLRVKMKAIKKAAGGQYGRQSPEVASVKGIAL